MPAPEPHRAGYRPSAMRQTSVRVTAACAVLLLSAAAGCGSDSGDSDDPGTATDTSSETPTTQPTTTDPDTSDSSTGMGASLRIGKTVEPGQAVIVEASNVDGETAERASALVDDQAVDAFLSAIDARLAADVRAAVDAVVVPADSTLFGAVVSVGCDTPTAVNWVTTFDGIEVTAEVPKSGVQCLVPVTSVALFLVPN